jgi:hypothetical protein
MSLLDYARVCIYRVNQKGLEIFLVNTGAEEWQMPTGKLSISASAFESDKMIELESDGQIGKILAIEGDWHEIPSIRKMIKDDVKIVASHVIKKLPEAEEGAYFAIKEAFKKVMPEEYNSLKELKDILIDRNQARYI